ncbi:hypothetical protein WR25_04953 [Diploscapter pachys]|uniref:Uncharacterized protein n=1 Tax=Diploscapter pachys TaxID=2018661 RepID=A0A2A2JQW2_9BILA|nr:hypothetical protein WR25_04953 [Diploscapter pachys]
MGPTPVAAPRLTDRLQHRHYEGANSLSTEHNLPRRPSDLSASYGTPATAAYGQERKVRLNRSRSRGPLGRVESRRQDEAHYTALRPDASGNGANSFSVESPLFAQQNQIHSIGSYGSASNGLHREKPVVGRPAPTATSTLGSSSSSLSRAFASMSNVSNVPMDALCKELIGALQGIKGTYFVASPTDNSIRISPSCAVSLSDKQTIERLLKIANLFIRLKKQAENAMVKTDAILQAFLMGVDKVLTEYACDMQDLKPVLSSPRPLTSIVQAVELWSERICELNRLQQLKLTGMSGIQMLDQLCISASETTFDNQQLHLMLQSILELCANAFGNRLEPWLLEGKLFNKDEKNWIIVKEQKMLEDGEISEQYKLNKIPIFMDQKIGKMILDIGLTWKMFDSKIASAEDVENVDRLCAIVRQGILRKWFMVSSPSPDLFKFLVRMRHSTGGTLLRSLVVKGRLLDHVECAQAFLLLDDPKFVVQLFESFYFHTDGLRIKLSTEKANFVLANALEHARKDEVSTKRKGLKFKLDVCLREASTTPPSSSRMELVFPLKPEYSVQGPIGDIFKQTSLSYERLFQFIWTIELMRMTMLSDAKLITDIQNSTRIATRAKGAIDFLVHKITELRYSCNHVMVQLRSYIHEVINLTFERQMKKAATVAVDFEEVKQMHGKYLTRIETALFQDKKDQIINDTIMQLVQMTDECSRKLRDFANKFHSDVQPITKAEFQKLTITRKSEETMRIKLAYEVLVRHFEMAFLGLAERFKKSLSSFIAQLENVAGFTADMELEYQMALGLAAKLVRNN